LASVESLFLVKYGKRIKLNKPTKETQMKSIVWLFAVILLVGCKDEETKIVPLASLDGWDCGGDKGNFNTAFLGCVEQMTPTWKTDDQLEGRYSV
jgi:hypothetical protein